MKSSRELLGGGNTEPLGPKNYDPVEKFNY
jgi:hypothetical protein